MKEVPAAEAWDREAAGFDDEADHGLRDPVARQAWADVLRRLLPEPPAKVVDLGCGTGSLSVLLAEHGYAVTGVDFSPSMLAAARQKARAAAVTVDLYLGDAADPRLAVRSFDVALCRHVLWALPDPGAALRRWLRLLTPDGIAVMIEGRWATGAGITAAALRRLVEEHASEITTERLDDPTLWGKDIADERYALVVQPRNESAGA